MKNSLGAGRLARGFTLIELMIAVAIIAILSSVVYPSYVDYIRRAQLPEGMTYLSHYGVKMEQYYQDHNGYGSLGGTACANEAPAPSWSNFAPNGSQYFTYTCSLSAANNNQGYVLTATGSAGRAVGHVYTLNHNIQKSTTTFMGTAVNRPCWLSKGSECS